MSSNHREECDPGQHQRVDKDTKLATYRKGPGLTSGPVARTNQQVRDWLCSWAMPTAFKVQDSHMLRPAFPPLPKYLFLHSWDPATCTPGRHTFRTSHLALSHLQRQARTPGPNLSPAYLSAAGLPALLWLATVFLAASLYLGPQDFSGPATLPSSGASAWMRCLS